MKRNSQGFTHLLLVFFIVLAGVGGLVYYSWQKGLVKTTPVDESQLQPTTVPDNTADWQTYTNPKGEYIFKFPAGLKTDTDAAGLGAESIRVTYISPNQGRKEGMLADGYSFTVTKIFTTDKKSSINEAETTYEGAKLNCPTESEFTPITTTTIDNRQGYVFSVKNCLADYTESYISNNQYIYRITQIYPGKPEDQFEYKKIVDQILSTFEFPN